MKHLLECLAFTFIISLVSSAFGLETFENITGTTDIFETGLDDDAVSATYDFTSLGVVFNIYLDNDFSNGLSSDDTVFVEDAETSLNNSVDQNDYPNNDGNENFSHAGFYVNENEAGSNGATVGDWDRGYISEPVGLDNYFLRSSSDYFADANNPNAAMIIDYDGSVNASGIPTGATGQIWDIDNEEGWTVTAYNTSGGVINSDSISFGADDYTLDGRAWNFVIGDDVQEIDYIAIQFTGAKTSGIGLAFDNFTASYVVIPEPALLSFLGFAVAGIGVAIRRRRC